MVKTKKNGIKRNTTKKHVKHNLALCPVGLKPFEENFTKMLSKSSFKKSSESLKKKFVNQLLIENDKDKQAIKDTLIDLVKTKILTKKDSVIYDSNKFKIISIPLLKFENGKYII